MADADNRTCKKCAELKPVSDFHFRKASRGRSPHRDGTCKACRNSMATENKRKRHEDPAARAEHLRKAGEYVESLGPDVIKFRNIRSRYGITRDQYVDMMLAQDFRCPVCTRPIEAGKWVVDHCHETGRVRGLLDSACNTFLGKARDNIATLSRAQVYLEVNGG